MSQEICPVFCSQDLFLFSYLPESVVVGSISIVVVVSVSSSVVVGISVVLGSSKLKKHRCFINCTVVNEGEINYFQDWVFMKEIKNLGVSM